MTTIILIPLATARLVSLESYQVALIPFVIVIAMAIFYIFIVIGIVYLQEEQNPKPWRPISKLLGNIEMNSPQRLFQGAEIIKMADSHDILIAIKALIEIYHKNQDENETRRDILILTLFIGLEGKAHNPMNAAIAMYNSKDIEVTEKRLYVKVEKILDEF